MPPSDIKDQLVEEIKGHLDPYLHKLNSYRIENEQRKIEIIGNSDNKPFTLIRIDVYEEWKQLYIPRIYLPDFLKHQGIGKKLIKVIYNKAKQSQYELFIAQMTDSFYARMRNRGALECEKSDMVQIVDTTILD